MMSKEKSYDWASAVVSLISTPSSDLRQLVKSSELNPEAGDLADVDLSGIDLSGQNLSGWDLRYATFKDANLRGTELRQSIIDPFSLAEAQAWEEAHLDQEARAATESAAKLLMPLLQLELSVRAINSLRNAGIKRVGDLVCCSEAELMRVENFGRKSLNEIKEVLAQMGLHLGMELPGWPPAKR